MSKGGFTPTNLRYMRQFYLTFPNCHALRDELSWTHYRMIMKVEDENARNFYVEECAKSNWSTRQLERQINSFYYQRLLSSRNKEDVSAEISRLEPGESDKGFWIKGGHRLNVADSHSCCFSPDGRFLLVGAMKSSQVVTYPIQEDGTPGDAVAVIDQSSACSIIFKEL